ncbi:scopoletin glucosyltransferase-like [Pyrus x bretschneideri]|uniref:scopoletin glucosyltransferase-like n=1 Tax=Pyrus x bretschneideri TaxID=225117 RepID=UPI0020300088|nr:scopoletin glucosyltransferase-like [Pyrus x bretschneideri]
MGSQNREFHVFLFPFMGHGHMIPISDMAKLFAAQGVKTTIVTTPLNASTFSKATQSSKTNPGSVKVEIKTIKFPSVEAGLPDGCEILDSLTSPELSTNFFKATSLLQEPLEQLLLDENPSFLLADICFPWATDAAAKFDIPRLVFHGTSFFTLAASYNMSKYEPFKNSSSDLEPFVIPNFPGEITMTRAQLPAFEKENIENDLTRMLKRAKESEQKSYGIVVNSFYELEPFYADYYRNVLGRKAWHIGPVSLCNRSNEENALRGKASSINENDCLKWLDSKEPNSVVYVCFGSMAKFNASQLKEIAMGLQASGQDFIWVVRRGQDDDMEKEDWLPEGFEHKMEGKGLIIRGWAPQILILDHRAVGGFVTHCGWNSTLEGISAGLPMVTWPVSADQFYNEKLVTQVLKIGVGVGAQKWASLVGDFVKKKAVDKAVRRIMVGEEAEEMRSRAWELAEQAKRAIEKGGSSHSDLNALIEELKSRG